MASDQKEGVKPKDTIDDHCVVIIEQYNGKMCPVCPGVCKYIKELTHCSGTQMNLTIIVTSEYQTGVLGRTLCVWWFTKDEQSKLRPKLCRHYGKSIDVAKSNNTIDRVAKHKSESTLLTVVCTSVSVAFTPKETCVSDAISLGVIEDKPIGRSFSPDSK